MYPGVYCGYVLVFDCSVGCCLMVIMQFTNVKLLQRYFALQRVLCKVYIMFIGINWL